MLTSTDTVLVIGTDQRPKGSKEPGAFAGGIRSDTMMLWRIGGGTSRRLSIPRDTVVPIPGHGVTKINAAYSYGGPGAGDQDRREPHRGQDQPPDHRQPRQLPQVHRRASAGSTVQTGADLLGDQRRRQERRLHAVPATRHPPPHRDPGADPGPDPGERAATPPPTTSPARPTSRRSSTRSSRQLVSPGIFFHLPWASWDAPKAVRTDMGGPTLHDPVRGRRDRRVGADRHPPGPPPAAARRESASGQAAIHKAVNKLMNGTYAG